MNTGEFVKQIVLLLIQSSTLVTQGTGPLKVLHTNTLAERLVQFVEPNLQLGNLDAQKGLARLGQWFTGLLGGRAQGLYTGGWGLRHLTGSRVRGSCAGASYRRRRGGAGASYHGRGLFCCVEQLGDHLGHLDYAVLLKS